MNEMKRRAAACPIFCSCVCGTDGCAPLFCFLLLEKMASSRLLEVKIRIVSDFACPWCYVGDKRLRNAMKLFESTLHFEVEWHPYIIDKGTDRNGEDYLAYNIRRWGGDGWVKDMKKSSFDDGCKFAQWNIWINSKHPHRMMQFAKSISLPHADSLKSILFQKYYEEGVNISLISELVLIGKELGMEGVEDYLLDENRGYADVIASDTAAKKSGINGVPYFTIECNGHTITICGAQPTLKWTNLFKKFTF